MTPMLDTFDFTSLLCELVEGGAPYDSSDVAEVKAGYQDTIAELEDLYEDSVAGAIKGMEMLAAFINNALIE